MSDLNLSPAEQAVLDKWPPPPMPDDIAERLGAVRQVAEPHAPAPVHAFSIHKFFVESGNDDGRPLRTHPNVLGVFLKEVAAAKTHDDVRSALQVAASRLSATGAFKDFSMETRTVPGLDTGHTADLHVKLSESTFSGRTEVTRTSAGTVEWAGELGLTNTLGMAETFRARVAHTKNDFSLQESLSDVKDTLSKGSGAAAAAVMPPSFEFSFEKPTLGTSWCRTFVALRRELADFVHRSSFVNKVREVEAGVFSPNNRHRLSYTCSWRSVIPNQNPNHLYLPDASAPIAAQSVSSLKSSVGYKYRVDSRPQSPVPVSGSLKEVTAEVAGLAGDVSFAKLEARWNQCGSVWRRQPDTGFAPALSRQEWEAARGSPNGPVGDFTWRNQVAGWLTPGLTLSISTAAGFLRSLGKDAYRPEGSRVIDRFFLGNPDMTGFDVAGVGPRGVRPDGAAPRTDALGGDAYLFSSLRAFLPPPFPSIRLANAGVRTEAFLCAGTLLPGLPSSHRDVVSTGRVSAGVAVVLPLMATMSLQIQYSVVKVQRGRDEGGSTISLVSTW